jgi:hypothetical protein
VRPDQNLKYPVVCGALLLLLTGCSLGATGGRPKVPAPSQITESHESLLVADYLRTLSHLIEAGNAEQAEIVDSARRAVSVDGTTANRLKLALMLAAPGHAGSNAADARSQLTELLAAPERLLPLERALATVMLATANSRAATDAENQRLRSDANRQDRERINTLTRRVQALADENEQLRKSLDEASAKLDAIATLERQMSGERRPSSTGAKP